MLKQFIIKLVVFSLPLILMAYLIDAIVTRGLRKTRDDRYSVWNDIFDGNVNVDVIVNGSSRAMVQVSPAILDSALGIKSYNLGCNGYGIRMQLCRFNVFAKRNRKPRVILHEVDYGTFSGRRNLFEIAQFLPYLDDPDIYMTTRKYEGFHFPDYHLPLLKYYADYPLIIVGALEYFDIKRFGGRRYKGYVGNDFPWSDELQSAREKFPNGITYDQQEELIGLFKLYLQRCQQDKIEVVLIWMPEYVEGQDFVLNHDSVRGMIHDISDMQGLTFFDYSNDSICFDRNLFYNTRHLNRKGAEIFTRKLAQDLKNHGIVE